MNLTDKFFDDRTLRMASTASRRVATIGRGLVEQADVLAHLYLWMWENRDRWDRWLAEEKPDGFFRGVLYRQGLDYLAKERQLRTGSERSDFTYYNRGLVKELLPDVWDHDAWLPAADPSAGRGASRPSEGNNRLAMLSDVSTAVFALSETDRASLQDLYADGGMPIEVAAELWGLTTDAARKKVDRIVDKVIDRLGGPAPWFYEKRRVRSNAAAQAETE